MKCKVLLTLAVLGCGPASGAPVTYACDLIEKAKHSQNFQRLDQLQLDIEAKTIVFRAANTIGTSSPIELDLTGALADEPAGQIIMKVGDKSVRAVGFLGVAGYSFFLSEHTASQSTASLQMAGNFMLWLCSR